MSPAAKALGSADPIHGPLAGRYKDAEQNYGSDLLNLVVAKGYLTKLLSNEAVKGHIQSIEPDVLEQFELVVNTVSLEEALQQQFDEPQAQTLDDL